MTPSPDAPLLLERRGRTLLLTLNRPERLNAVSLPLYRALVAALDALEEDDGLRVAVLTGAGRAFCVGADLKAHAGRGAASDAPTDADAPAGSTAARDPDALDPASAAAERKAYVRAAQRANERVQRVSKPVIAAVNGHAIGGGLELALSCDLILVAEEAKLRFPELALGTFVGGGVTYTLPRRVGLAKARELLYLAEFFSGSEAAAMGLANRALPAAEVLPGALAWAERVAALAPVPTRLAKGLLAEAATAPRRRVLRREARALLEVMDTDDWKEGLAAFHEKRDARYRGR